MITSNSTTVPLLAKWSVTTTAYEKHQYRNSQPYTDTPLSRYERAALLPYQAKAVRS